MIFSFFDGSSLVCYLLIKFHYLFPFLLKYYHIIFIIFVFGLVNNKLFSCFFAGFLLFSPKG